MLNYIWVAMIVLSCVTAPFTSNTQALSEAVLNGVETSGSLVFDIGAMMCFWCAIMKIAERSGFTGKICKLLLPVTKILFPDLESDSPAIRAISMNMTANLLGLANAATPFGIMAVREICKIKDNTKGISKELAMLVVLNTASIQLIPTTVIALRTHNGALNPFDTVVPTIIASFTALVVAVISVKLFIREQK